MIDSLVDLLDNADDDKDLFINQIERMTPILSKESWEILYDSFAELIKNMKQSMKFYFIISNYI